MYGGLEVSDGPPLKTLEEEGRQVKPLAGEQALVIETLKKPHH